MIAAPYTPEQIEAIRHGDLPGETFIFLATVDALYEALADHYDNTEILTEARRLALDYFLTDGRYPRPDGFPWRSQHPSVARLVELLTGERRPQANWGPQ